ncbi:MAG TPA: Tox-REase-5 domain-containing protein [Beijerinckiaceae bacterium]|nr:Tox-REase-5 domain-containing protein [Beijerinckiaceae bacterium]
MGGQLSRQALTGLALLAERFSAPTAFLGTIFIPSNSDLQRRGTIPDRPDIAFDYDEDTGVLKLSRDGDVFFAGQNQRGIFRDEQGRAFGRYVGGNIVLDPDALPITAAQAHQDADSGVGAQSFADTGTVQGEPKLCPKPSPEPSSSGFSLEAQLYQWQITKLDPGLGVKINGVMFDGCRESDGTMLEAKNAYLHFMIGSRSDRWIWQNKIEPNMMKQARDQWIAAKAAGRRVEWYFAEKPVADYFRNEFRRERFDNITVFYEPYIIEIIDPNARLAP